MPRSLRSPDNSSQRLQNFVNREAQLGILKRVLDLPAGQPLPVLMFSGVGGSGKSWLLRKLREALPAGIPAASIDLEPSTGGTPYHADSSRSLAELRRQFADVDFPRFDLAYAWLRYKEGVKEEPLLRGSGAAAFIFNFITDNASGLVQGVPFLNLLLKQGGWLVKKQLKNSAIEQWLSEVVGQEDFQRLRQATAQELYAELTER